MISILLIFFSTDSVAQKTRSSSPFYTIGGKRHLTKSVFCQVVDKDSASCVEEEGSVADSLADVGGDSIGRFVPLVALPLRSVTVTSPFGVRHDPMNRKRRRFHYGLDLRARYESVFSMLPGRVVRTGYSESGGYYVTVSHGVCVCSYLHLSRILVRRGEHVGAGQCIAISGNSGSRTTGPSTRHKIMFSEGEMRK